MKPALNNFTIRFVCSDVVKRQMVAKPNFFPFYLRHLQFSRPFLLTFTLLFSCPSPGWEL